ncbi:nuclear transport factor 2 family protein [Mycolicibacterium parafortuitum]|uniref:nuclear transport factor 2 family protein n=1 Tax=Mycolicibacterium parafortuitum TaxID=39692 RepID=UPI0013D11A2C|nr:ketosteroid isomerase family protein [Mycolicibacterium parafortuitum]
MPFTRADVLTAAQRSLAAAGSHDRAGWVGLFTADGRVEDPVGSAPHHGRVAIGRFYDTFIGPRTITAHVDGDIVVGGVMSGNTGGTVIRDVELEIEMADALTMRVPTYIRYDLRTDGDQLRISALSAFWELPAMAGQFATGGLAAVPAGISLGRAMFGNQGLRGSLGFLTGFRGPGRSGKDVFTRFLDGACAGDEVGMRRLLSDSSVTLGDSDPITTSDLLKHVSGGVWDKLIASGRYVAARVLRDGQRLVLIGEIAAGPGDDRVRISQVRMFAEVAPGASDVRT